MTRLMRRTRLRWQLMPKHAKKWRRRLKVARDLSIPASRASRSLGRSEIRATASESAGKETDPPWETTIDDERRDDTTTVSDMESEGVYH